MKIRAFLAFELPEEFRLLLHRIFRNLTVQFPGNFKPEGLEKLHITVKFLGDIDEERVNVLKAAMKKALNAPDFIIQTEEFGFFGSRKEPRVLWAGADFRPSLEPFLGEVDNVLHECNLPEIGKDFKPHITLMRVKKKLADEFLDKFLSLDVTNLKGEIRSFVLYESKLLKTGSVYKPILKIN